MNWDKSNLLVSKGLTYLDRIYIVLLATLVVHDGNIVIPDVQLLISALRISLLVRHERGHMERDTYHVVLPDVRELSVVSVLLQPAQEEHLRIDVLQLDQRPEAL